MINIQSPCPARRLRYGVLTLACVAIALCSCTGVQHADHRHLQSGEGHYDAVLHDTHEHRIVGDGNKVLITNTHGNDTGYSLAKEYCAGRGRSAQMQKPIRYVSRRIAWNSIEFECIGED